MFFKHLTKIGNVCESLVRNGYEIYINDAREVYFFYDSDFHNYEGIFDCDGELISAFLNGRTVTAYYSMLVEEVSAPFSPAVPISAPVAEPVAKPVDSTPIVPDTSAPTTPAFKPSLTYCAEVPAQSTDFLEVLGSEDDEYVIYAKTDNTFHIHWKVDRDQAKEVWRRDRAHIQQWLGADADNLNTVSWDEPVDNGNSNAKWKEILPETTKLSTVLRQVVSFGKRIADLAILEDGSHHVYFYLSRQEAKQVYSHVKSEFGNYPITSVSFES